MTKLHLGTPCITTPNLYGTVVYETPKTVEVEVVGVDFTPKTGKSGRLTHKFENVDRQYLTNYFVGQRRKFWKESGKQVGGGKYSAFLIGRF